MRVANLLLFQRFAHVLKALFKGETIEPDTLAEDPELFTGKILIVGLGNPGPKYRGTPHNVGFEVVNALAEKWRIDLEPSRQVEAIVGAGRYGEREVHLLKPLTFMNLSGSAVAPFLRRRAMQPGQTLIVLDDIDLPLGRLRLRNGGSHAGHKGLLSVLNALGTRDVPRLRIGIRPPDEEKPDTTEYVLRKSPPEEQALLGRVCELAVDVVECALDKGLTAAMNDYNRRTVE
jgi:PTH1 family peptidyl-tRNA hydrolase